jgi:hypothetical protein
MNFEKEDAAGTDLTVGLDSNGAGNDDVYSPETSTAVSEKGTDTGTAHKPEEDTVT